jgi:hydrogenase expression/formation protein HypC
MAHQQVSRNKLRIALAPGPSLRYSRAMCVAMPMRVVEISSDGEGIVELGGVRRRISFKLLGDAAPGDYVLVHAGFAIGKVDEAEAQLTLDALAECGGEGNDFSGAPA